jgi:Flp pilus assembly protein TadD
MTMPAYSLSRPWSMIILLSGTALMLSACASTGPTQGKNDVAGKVLEQAADQVGNGPSALPLAEKMYKRNPDDVNNAVRYSHALREAGRLSRASIIMTPFAKDDRKPNAAAKTEFAAIQAELGNYDVAADNARKAIAMDGKSWQAYHVLGISLDAKGDHAGAEKALRKALELSPPEQQTAILNNLGLNLATQGFLDEAAETLRKALETAPDRSEVERNLRIVSALRESGGRAPSYMQNAHDAAQKKEAAVAAGDKAIAKKPAAKETEDSENKDSPVPVPVKKPTYN